MPQETSPEMRAICRVILIYHVRCVSTIHYGEEFPIKINFSISNGGLSHVGLEIITDGKVEPGPYPYSKCEFTMYGRTKVVCYFDDKDEVAGNTEETLFFGQFTLFPMGKVCNISVNTKPYGKNRNTDYDYIYATASSEEDP